MRAVILSNGYIENYDYYLSQLTEDDFIICADGAIKHCINMNLIPNLWVGDFDSCKYEDVCLDNPYLRNVEFVKLNPQKDETDTHKCCLLAIDRHFDQIVIWGATGGRLDHSLSNIFLLEHLHKLGIKACIEDENNIISVFDDYVCVPKRKKYISLIPIDRNVKVIETRGLYYSLKNFTFERGISLGVSNEFDDDTAEIFISGGIMLIIQSNDKHSLNNQH